MFSVAKSERAARRLLETSTKYLEETLKLKVSQEKSRVVSVFAIRNFKFLGFTLGKNGKGIYVRVHGKSWKKMKSKLKELSSRRSCQSIRPSLEKIKVYMRERIMELDAQLEVVENHLVQKCKEIPHAEKI